MAGNRILLDPSVTVPLHHLIPAFIHLLAHDDALPPRGANTVVVLRFTAALGARRIAAARASAVELDAVAGARDAIALASAARGSRRDRAWCAAVAAARAERRNI